MVSKRLHSSNLSSFLESWAEFFGIVEIIEVIEFVEFAGLSNLLNPLNLSSLLNLSNLLGLLNLLGSLVSLGLLKSSDRFDLVGFGGCVESVEFAAC